MLVIDKKVIKPVKRGFNIPEGILREAMVYYSPSFEKGSSRIHTGLTFDEQKEYLPDLIGVSATDVNFQSKVENYFADFKFNIPYEGVEIDASYEKIENEIKPVNLHDFVLCKMLITDSNVCNEQEDNIEFYSYMLIDKQKQKELEENVFLKSKEANKSFIKITSEDKNDKLIQVLTMLHNVIELPTFEIDNLTRIELEQKLKLISEKEPEKFVKAVSSDKLLLKSLIASALDLNIITTTGVDYFYEEEKIANTKSQLYAYFDDNTKLAKLTSVVGSIKKNLKL